MTHTIIIETNDDMDFELIKSLVNRLGLPFKEIHLEGLTEKQEAAF